MGAIVSVSAGDVSLNGRISLEQSSIAKITHVGVSAMHIRWSHV